MTNVLWQVVIQLPQGSILPLRRESRKRPAIRAGARSPVVPIQGTFVPRHPLFRTLYNKAPFQKRDVILD
jgi:hypothetical protein